MHQLILTLYIHLCHTHTHTQTRMHLQPAPRNRRRPANSGSSGSGSQAQGDGVLQFYTQGSTGLTVGPTSVLVLSLFYVGTVVLLHIWGKIRG